MNEARIQALMRDVDRSLLRENLKLTPAERLEKFISRVHAEGPSCRPAETPEEEQQRNLEEIAELRVLLEETLRQS